MTRELAILADDFTGACDAAAPFAATGFETRVLVGTACVTDGTADVLAYDLDLREQSDAVARQVTATAGRRLAQARLYLKIDSTLRGPIRGMVDGALEGSGRRHAVAAPAFPAQGRYIRNGRLCMADGSTGPSLVEVLGADSTTLLRATDVHALASIIRDRILAVDADDATSLRGIAAAWGDHPEWLLAGSAGLAREVAGLWGGAPTSRQAAGPSRTPGRTLVIAGSPAAATQRQLERLAGHADIAVVEPGQALPPPHQDAAVVVLTTGSSPTRDDGERAQALADVISTWARAEWTPDAVVLVGGRTGRAVCDVLAVQHLALEGELQPGIAIGRLRGGVWDQVRVVTKAGGFGGPDALLDAVRASGVSSKETS